MEFGAFLGRGKLSEQVVGISLNGQRIQTFVLESEYPEEHKLFLPKELLRQRNVLVFDLPNADSPQSLDIGDDARDLGISMHWIELRQK